MTHSPTIFDLQERLDAEHRRLRFTGPAYDCAGGEWIVVWVRGEIAGWARTETEATIRAWEGYGRLARYAKPLRAAEGEAGGRLGVGIDRAPSAEGMAS